MRMIFGILFGLVLSVSVSVPTATMAGGKAQCPAGTKLTSITDTVTNTKVQVCEHPTVNLANGHPAYDQKAKCTPGETREFQVKTPKGYRVVRQTCTNNF